MTTPVISVRGGIAEVEVGFALIIDFDNITEDMAAAEAALESLKSVENQEDVKHIQDWILEVWPVLAESQDDDD